MANGGIDPNTGLTNKGISNESHFLEQDIDVIKEIDCIIDRSKDCICNLKDADFYKIINSALKNFNYNLAEVDDLIARLNVSTDSLREYHSEPMELSEDDTIQDEIKNISTLMNGLEKKEIKFDNNNDLFIYTIRYYGNKLLNIFNKLDGLTEKCEKAKIYITTGIKFKVSDFDKLNNDFKIIRSFVCAFIKETNTAIDLFNNKITKKKFNPNDHIIPINTLSSFRCRGANLSVDTSEGSTNKGIINESHCLEEDIQDIDDTNKLIKDLDYIINSSKECTSNLKFVIKDTDFSKINSAFKQLNYNLEKVNDLVENFEIVTDYLIRCYHDENLFKNWVKTKEKLKIIDPLKDYLKRVNIEFKWSADFYKDTIRDYEKKLLNIFTKTHGLIKKCNKAKEDIISGIKFNGSDLNKLKHEFKIINSFASTIIKNGDSVIDFFNDKIIEITKQTVPLSEDIESFRTDSSVNDILLEVFVFIKEEKVFQNSREFYTKYLFIENSRTPLNSDKYKLISKAYYDLKLGFALYASYGFTIPSDKLNDRFNGNEEYKSISSDKLNDLARNSVYQSITSNVNETERRDSSASNSVNNGVTVHEIRGTPKPTIYIKLNENQAYTLPLDTKNNNYVFYYDRIDNEI